MNSLTNQVKELEFTLKNPRLFITNYFDEIINQIDKESYDYIDKLKSNDKNEAWKLNSEVIEVIKKKRKWNP